MIKRILAASAALAMSAVVAHAQEVKVGLVAPFTGIGAELGQQIDRGVQQYLKLKADEFKPYKITIIKRDDKDPSGANSKIAVQELLTQDNVDALADQEFGIADCRFAAIAIIHRDEIDAVFQGRAMDALGDGLGKR